MAEDQKAGKQQNRSESPKQKDGPKLAPDAHVMRLTTLYPQPATLLRQAKTLAEISNTCVYALDTSCLISPYDAGSETLTEVNKILSKLIKEGRVRIPAQSLREFVNRRSTKVGEIYAHLKQRMAKAQSFTKIDNRLIQSMERYKKLAEKMESANKAIADYRDELNDLVKEVKDWNWNDPVSSHGRSMLHWTLHCEVSEYAMPSRCSSVQSNSCSPCERRC